jgi:predicted Rdx family selenoprotein
MKTLTLLTGLLVAVSANAAFTLRATLVGQHLNSAFAGDPLLICEYSGAGAKFEILSQTGKCAPYITIQ